MVRYDILENKSRVGLTNEIESKSKKYDGCLEVVGYSTYKDDFRDKTVYSAMVKYWW